jgi:hypothetical protein
MWGPVGNCIAPRVRARGQILGFPAFADDTPAMVRFHARRVQTAWEATADLFKGKEYRASAHFATAVAAGSVYLRMPQLALLYIQECCGFVQAGNLRFVPTYGRPPEFSDDLHEILVALSQTMYWANYLFLMCGGPEPHATAKLEKEFRQELPVGNISSPLSYAELIFDSSERTRFSLISVLWQCGRKASCSSGTRFCSSGGSLRTVSVTRLPPWMVLAGIQLGRLQTSNSGDGGSHAIDFWRLSRGFLRACLAT